MTVETYRPRRSVLYMPASNERALVKIASLACNAVVIDLKDGVAPADKVSARDRVAGRDPRFQARLFRCRNERSGEKDRRPSPPLIVATSCPG